MNRLPIFKHIHPIFRTGEKIIRLGDVYGTAVELEDENGAIQRLIKLMDGRRNYAEIFHELKKSFSEVTYDEMVEAIHELHNLGFLYDQCSDEMVNLSEKENERYKANINFFSNFANFDKSPKWIQDRLKKMKITVLGMGAFGSGILINLAGLGVGNIRIVDFDTVELSNLNRQILFNESDIGKLKVEVAQEFIAKFNSDINIHINVMEIKSPKDVEQVVSESDFVVLAADQPFFILQRWVNEACVRLGIPFIVGGTNLTEGMFYTVEPEKTGCVDCLHLHRSQLAEDYPQIFKSSISNNFIPPTATIAPNIMMITGMISSEVCRYITGTSDVLSYGKMLSFNFMSLELKTLFNWERDTENCPTCGNGEGDTLIFKVLNNPDYSQRRVVRR